MIMHETMNMFMGNETIIVTAMWHKFTRERQFKVID